MHYEKSCPPKPHYPTTKTLKKKQIYNNYVIIPWVLQPLCNYPLKNIVY